MSCTFSTLGIRVGEGRPQGGTPHTEGCLTSQGLFNLGLLGLGLIPMCLGFEHQSAA